MLFLRENSADHRITLLSWKCMILMVMNNALGLASNYDLFTNSMIAFSYTFSVHVIYIAKLSLCRVKCFQRLPCWVSSTTLYSQLPAAITLLTQVAKSNRPIRIDWIQWESFPCLKAHFCHTCKILLACSSLSGKRNFPHYELQSFKVNV